MKVKLFIDGRNFFFSMQRHMPNGRIDYDKLAQTLVKASGAKVFAGAYYYTGIDLYRKNEKIENFLDGLSRREGYFVVKQPRARRILQCPNCAEQRSFSIEKGIDTRLSVDMISFAARRACDCIVLLSGDSDFLPAIQATNSFGIQTWVATWGNELSDELRTNCYGFINLRELVREFALASEES